MHKFKLIITFITLILQTASGRVVERVWPGVVCVWSARQISHPYHELGYCGPLKAMKRSRFLTIVLALLFGMTLGCMLTLIYLQQLVLGRCISPRSGTGNMMVDREIMSVVSVNEHFRTNGLTRLGCVCGQDVTRLKDAAQKLLERVSQQSLGDMEQKEIEVLRSALTSSSFASVSSSSSTNTTTVSPLSSSTNADSEQNRTAGATAGVNVSNPHKCGGESAGLLVAMLTSAERLNRSSVAFETWGLDMSQVVVFLSNDTNLAHHELQGLPFVLLEGVEDNTEKNAPRKLFKALKYLQQHFSEQYSWFLLVSPDVYVHGQQLEEFLCRLNPNRKLYIGHPAAGRVKDSQRLKLFPHEQYCMGGPGVVLSRAALQALAPHLNWCLEVIQKHNQDSSEPQWYNEDVELGRCISRTISVQCSTDMDKVSGFTFDVLCTVCTYTIAWDITATDWLVYTTNRVWVLCHNGNLPKAGVRWYTHLHSEVFRKDNL